MLSTRSFAIARNITARRYLSTRASRVLSAVGLPTDGAIIPGVYDGQWKGSGGETQSKCPATGEILATIRSVSYGPGIASKLTVRGQ